MDGEGIFIFLLIGIVVVYFLVSAVTSERRRRNAGQQSSTPTPANTPAATDQPRARTATQSQVDVESQSPSPVRPTPPKSGPQKTQTAPPPIQPQASVQFDPSTFTPTQDRRASSGKIFISYRREDSATITEHIYQALIREFGTDRVFKDVDTIPKGADWQDILEQAVSKARVLLAVIGENWLDATDDTGKRRLDSPEDFVRVEIEHAIDRKIPIIPVLIDDISIPLPEQLPAALKMLPGKQATRMRSGPGFTQDVYELINDIYRALDKPMRF